MQNLITYELYIIMHIDIPLLNKEQPDSFGVSFFALPHSLQMCGNRRIWL